MNGEKKSEPVEIIEKKVLTVIERINTEWDKVGLTNVGKPNGIEQLINADEVYLKSLTREECGHKSFLLSRYALYLQQEENKLQAILDFLTNALDVVIGKEGKNYGDKFSKYEEKRFMVIAHNIYANTLNKEIAKYSQNIKSISFTSNKIQKMSDRLIDISNGKRQI